MSDSKKSFLNIFTGVLGQVITILIGLLLPRLFITNYGSETNGFLSSVNSVITYLSLLEAGVGGATIQALYGPIKREDRNSINRILSATNSFYKRTGIIYALFIVVLAFGYPLVVSSDLNFWLQAGIILIIGAGGVLSYLCQAKYKLLFQAEGKQFITTNITTIIYVATSVMKLVLVSFGVVVIWVQATQLLLAIVGIVYYYAYVRKHYAWLDLSVEPDKEAISQKNSVLVHQISEMIFNHIDVLLLTLLVQDLKVVSVYGMYMMVVDMISTLIGNVNSGFIFRMGQLYNTDPDEHNRVFDTYETYYMMFSFALYAVTYMFLLPFMKLYTAGVSDTDYLLPLLPLFFTAYKLLVCGRGVCGTLASYAGHFHQTLSHSIIETSINLIVSIVAVLYFQKQYGLGIYGVLIGTIAALLFRANIMIIYANRVLLNRKVSQTYKKWLVNLVLTIIVCGAFSFLPIRLDNYFRLIFWAAIVTLSVLVLFFAINSFLHRDNYRELKGYIRSFVFKMKKNEEMQ